jgi:hypothetical protein
MRSFCTPTLLLLLAASFSLVHAATEPDKTEKPLSPQEAREAMHQKIESFGWTRTGKGRLGTAAEIAIPSG